MTTAQEILHELQTLGTEQNRKVYKRHGAHEPLYGVSFAHLDALQKRLKINHALALELWASRVHEARILATRIADPKQVDMALASAWAAVLDNYGLTDAFSHLLSQTSLAATCMAQWLDADAEFVSTAGWNLLTAQALRDKSLADSYFEPFLATIGRDIHQRPNRTRYAMNNALIAIGLRSPALQAQALAVAAAIGSVIVDHGQTGCKTPAAAAYILKASARKHKGARS